MAAEAVVRALGRVPVARTPFREEASMQLVRWWLAGERAAARAHAGQGDPVRARALIAQVMAPGHADDKARSEAAQLLATLPPA
jgi:hypothetical protein